jgi:hypothetical protein
MAKAVKDFDSKVSKMKVIFSKYQARETSRGNAGAAREIAESSMDAAGRQRETCQIIWQRLVANAPKMTAFDFSATAWREMYRLRNPRHILSKRIDIERLISSNNVSLICGAVGSGKSSQVPQYLADHPLLQDVLVRQISRNPTCSDMGIRMDLFFSVRLYRSIIWSHLILKRSVSLTALLWNTRLEMPSLAVLVSASVCQLRKLPKHPSILE